MGQKYIELLEYLNKALNKHYVTINELNKQGFENDVINNLIDDGYIRERDGYISITSNGYDYLENRKKANNKKPSIFLSHSWEDKFFVRKLGKQLQENGVTVWIDEAEIKVGDSLIEKISEAIKKCDFVGAILSHNSVSSSWVQKELELAMTQEIKGEKVKIIPILLEKCDIPNFLEDKLYADFTKADDPRKFEKEILQILGAIGIKKRIVKIPTKKRYVVTDRKKVTIKVIKPEDALADFEDIKIVDIDKSKLYNPNSNKALYHVPFVLSRYPPSEWSKIFDSERKFPRHTRWRKAWVEGQYIIVHCPLDEVKTIHFSDLKHDVENTNKQYREYLFNKSQEKKIEMQEKVDGQKKIDDALDGLDFN